MGGGGPFTPASLSNLALWIEAADTSTMFQSNAGVTAVTDTSVCGYAGDKSGNSFPLISLANDGTRPTWNNNSGNSYLLFDGVDDILVRTASLGLYAAGACSLFIACRVVTAATNKYLFAEANSSITTQFIGWQISDGTTASSAAMFERNDGNTTQINGVIKTNVFAAGTDIVYGITDNGSTITPYLDGVSSAGTGYTRGGSMTLDTTSLGGLDRGATPSNWFNIRVHAVVATKSVPSAGQIASLTTYLGAKQGRTI
jgi:hypothetical protein